jgi:hypothetical protein
MASPPISNNTPIPIAWLVLGMVLLGIGVNSQRAGWRRPL